MADDDKLARIVEARLKLKARFEAKMAQTPSLRDDAPMGSGPPNRHGMPKLPIGQYDTTKWPVLDLGAKPLIPNEAWRLTLDGAVANPTELTYEALRALPQTIDESDFHCVTTWSRMNMRWEGVRFEDLAALVEPREEARFVFIHAYDGYTTNLPLEEALKPDVLVAHTVDGGPLPVEHGGPVRMITPQLYAWKGAKWIKRVEFLAEDRLGFWEQRGYSNTAHPWRNDRYS